MKPFIKIALVILIIVVIGLIVYFVWSSVATPTPEVTVVPNTNLPVAPNEGGPRTQPAGSGSTSSETIPILSKISESSVFDYWVDAQTQEVYYLNSDGQIFSGKNGADLQITQQKLSAPNFIKISPNSQKVLTAFGDPRLPQWGIFDVIDGVWRPLPSDILNATWGSDNNTLIGTVKNSNNLNLSYISLGQNNPTYKIINNDFRFQDASLDFMTPNSLIIKENPSASYPGRMWSLNLKDQSFHLMVSPKNGLVMKISLDGRMMFLFSADTGFQIVNSTTLSLVVPIPFLTLPSKCSPDSAVIYCFVPVDKDFAVATLPDDYFQQKVYTNDVLYKINVATGDVNPIVFPQGAGDSIDAKNPQFSGGKLYFINRRDNLLYSLTLGPDNQTNPDNQIID